MEPGGEVLLEVPDRAPSRESVVPDVGVALRVPAPWSEGVRERGGRSTTLMSLSDGPKKQGRCCVAASRAHAWRTSQSIVRAVMPLRAWAGSLAA